MFKELKVIKLIVFVGMFILIISNIDFSDNIIDELYTDKASYNANETIQIYSSTKSFLSLSRTIAINDVSGETVSEISIPLKEQAVIDNPVENGLGFTSNGSFTLQKPGLYFIENKYPVIIKSNKAADITVVYPFANNVLYCAHGYNNAFSHPIKNASLNRTSPIDIYTNGLLPFFEFLNERYSVNYITDVDLENYESYKNSKLLIVYGKLTCSTQKMNKGISTYIENKGNLLLINSYALNNVCWFDEQKNSITMYNDTSSALLSWLLYNKQTAEKTIGISYVFGETSKDSLMMLVNEGHPILKGLDVNQINLKGHLYSSPPIKWFDDIPRVDLNSIDFYKADIIAYGQANRNETKGIKGIFVLQPDTSSGKIVSLGSEDWALKENYQDNEQIQRITKNSIDFLVK